MSSLGIILLWFSLGHEWKVLRVCAVLQCHPVGGGVNVSVYVGPALYGPSCTSVCLSVCLSLSLSVHSNYTRFTRSPSLPSLSLSLSLSVCRYCYAVRRLDAPSQRVST